MAKSQRKHIVIDFPVFLSQIMLNEMRSSLPSALHHLMAGGYCFALPRQRLAPLGVGFGSGRLFGSGSTPSLPRLTGEPTTGTLIPLLSGGITF
jgi:hypothetical protein